MSDLIHEPTPEQVAACMPDAAGALGYVMRPHENNESAWDAETWASFRPVAELLATERATVAALQAEAKTARSNLATLQALYGSEYGPAKVALANMLADAEAKGRLAGLEEAADVLHGFIRRANDRIAWAADADGDVKNPEYVRQLERRVNAYSAVRDAIQARVTAQPEQAEKYVVNPTTDGGPDAR